MISGRALPRRFFERDALTVAPELLGSLLVHRAPSGLRVGRIVETEAYQGPEDLAAHSSRGRRTERTEVMFGPGGYAYVYLIYGMWNCLNVVTSTRESPHAVLIRAVEPLGEEEWVAHGPGLLCKAFEIDRSLNGVDLRGDVLWIERPKRPLWRAPILGEGPRIGVDYAGDWAKNPWRFFDSASPCVSLLTVRERRRRAALLLAE